MWIATTAQEVATLRGHTGSVYDVVWSPDGSRLVTNSDDGTGRDGTGRDGTGREWDAATGREVAVFRGLTGTLSAASWSPDGTRLATLDGQVTHVWDAATGHELDALRGLGNERADVTWSPDGTRLASLTKRGDPIQVWDGSPLDASAHGRLDRLWRALPRPEWHLDEATAAFAAGRHASPRFHFDRYSPGPAARCVQRGQYALTAAATVLAGERRGVPSLVMAALRPPGYDDNATGRAALLDATNDPAAVAAWRRLARAAARGLKLPEPPAILTDRSLDHWQAGVFLRVAHFRRLAGDNAAADAALANAASRFPFPRHLLSRDIAATIAAGAGAPELRLPLAMAVSQAWQDHYEFDDYAIHGTIPVPEALYRLTCTTDVAQLRTRKFDTLFAATRGFSFTGRTHLCASIAYGQTGDASAARAALMKADEWFLNNTPGDLLLRREAVVAIAALEAKPK